MPHHPHRQRKELLTHCPGSILTSDAIKTEFACFTVDFLSLPLSALVSCNIPNASSLGGYSVNPPPLPSHVWWIRTPPSWTLLGRNIVSREGQRIEFMAPPLTTLAAWWRVELPDWPIAGPKRKEKSLWSHPHECTFCRQQYWWEWRPPAIVEMVRPKLFIQKAVQN